MVSVAVDGYVPMAAEYRRMVVVVALEVVVSLLVSSSSSSTIVSEMVHDVKAAFCDPNNKRRKMVARS